MKCTKDSREAIRQMTNFFPISDFSFPTNRLSDFFGPLSGSPDGLLLYNNAPPPPTRSDELRRRQWPWSATFGEAKSAPTFRLSQFPTFRHPVSDFPTFRLSDFTFPTLPFRLLLSDFPTSPFRLSDFPTSPFRLSDFTFPTFQLSDFPTLPFRLSDITFPTFRLSDISFPAFRLANQANSTVKTDMKHATLVTTPRFSILGAVRVAHSDNLGPDTLS
jgi:hypothetical protein